MERVTAKMVEEQFRRWVVAMGHGTKREGADHYALTRGVQGGFKVVVRLPAGGLVDWFGAKFLTAREMDRTLRFARESLRLLGEHARMERANTFDLTFRTNTDAFRVDDDGRPDDSAMENQVLDILFVVGKELRAGHRGNAVVDNNGHTIGAWHLHDDAGTIGAPLEKPSEA